MQGMRLRTYISACGDFAGFGDLRSRAKELWSSELVGLMFEARNRLRSCVGHAVRVAKQLDVPQDIHVLLTSAVCGESDTCGAISSKYFGDLGHPQQSHLLTSGRWQSDRAWRQ